MTTAPTATSCATLAGSESCFWGNTGVGGVSGCFWGLSFSSAPYRVVTVKNSQTTVFVDSSLISNGSSSNVFHIISGTSIGSLTWSVPVALGTMSSIQGASLSVKTPVVLNYYGQVPAKQTSLLDCIQIR